MTTIEEVRNLWLHTCESVTHTLISAEQNQGARFLSHIPDVDKFIRTEIVEKYQGLMTHNKSYIPVVYRCKIKDFISLFDSDSSAYFHFINSFGLYGTKIDSFEIIYFALVGISHEKEKVVDYLSSNFLGPIDRCITFLCNADTGKLMSYQNCLAGTSMCPGHSSVSFCDAASKDWQWKHVVDLLKTSKIYVMGRLTCEAFMYKFGDDSTEVQTAFTTGEKFLSTEMGVAEHIVARDSYGNSISTAVIDHKFASVDFHVYEKTGSGRSTKVLLQDIAVSGSTRYLKCDMKVCPDCGRYYYGDWCPNCYVTTEDTGNLMKKTDCFEYDGHYYENKQNLKTCCICGKQAQEAQGKFIHGKYFVCGRHDIADDTLHYMEDYCDGVTGVISDYHANDTPIKFFITEDKDIVSYSKRGYRDMFGSENNFKGLGFELEVDKCQYSGCERSIYNNLTANYILSDTGFDRDELFFEYDGSLNEGFEIISQPHTEKAFWQREPEFRKMLSFLKKAGYHSHDAGTCGLHLHISKSYFGDTEQKQNFNIAKIYKFYDEYWSDIKVASRRCDTCYCNLNKLESRNVINKNDKKEIDKVHEWTHQADMDKRTHHHSSSHHVALNNSHDETFEIRLGRGTLNEASFFSWIDLTLTLVHNCTKSSDKLKDAKEWLKGIKATTAIYLLRRGCFTAAVEQLFPDIAEAMRNNSDQTRD